MSTAKQFIDKKRNVINWNKVRKQLISKNVFLNDLDGLPTKKQLTNCHGYYLKNPIQLLDSEEENIELGISINF